MPTIENFATVSYTSGNVTATKVSNVAEIQLTSSTAFSKTTLGDTYTANTPVTYVISITNASGSPITGITVSDDLGTYAVDGTEYTPLTYEAPALLLINGQDSTATLTVDDSVVGVLTFTFPTLPAGATANIIYKAIPNAFAPLSVDNTITNTASLIGNTDCAGGEASATVTVLEAADVEVVKSMSPNPVVCGNEVTYTIRIYNYGNIPATDVVLTDNFNPAPTQITVSRNGIVLVASDYVYESGTLTVPSNSTSGDSIPAATFVRDPITGEISVTPGVVEYVITGTI